MRLTSTNSFETFELIGSFLEHFYLDEKYVKGSFRVEIVSESEFYVNFTDYTVRHVQSI